MRLPGEAGEASVWNSELGMRNAELRNKTIRDSEIRGWSDNGPSLVASSLSGDNGGSGGAQSRQAPLHTKTVATETRCYVFQDLFNKALL